LEEKVVAGLLNVATHWPNFCMKVKEITGIYKSMGEDGLDMEIFEEYILYLPEKKKKENIREKRKRFRRIKKERQKEKG